MPFSELFQKKRCYLCIQTTMQSIVPFVIFLKILPITIHFFALNIYGSNKSGK